MSDRDMKTAREVHNQIAIECAERIIREIPDPVNRLIALESIIVGVIGMMWVKPGGDRAILGMLLDGVAERLAQWRADRPRRAEGNDSTGGCE